MIKLLVVDDQSLIRDGIASLLDLHEDLTVAGTASNGLDAISAAKTYNPDVILMDIHMPELDGIAATAKIKEAYPDCQVLMLTTFDDEEYIVKALQAGASGYLLKDLPTEDLAKAIRLLHKGIYQLDPQIAGLLVQSLAKVDTQKKQQASTAEVIAKTGLTDRELEVLKLIGAGATNQEISDSLSITLGTVKNHVSNILMRAELRDRTAAAIFAHENNLI